LKSLYEFNKDGNNGGGGSGGGTNFLGNASSTDISLLKNPAGIRDQKTFDSSVNFR
jgi:hypothetical protein